jgi:putative Ca2+/H+ antiporter (TMEM165/GDT1 family)
VNLAAFVATFLVVLAVELPDKTLMATLVLAGRYRAVPVVAGAAAAFFVQCAIAVLAGQVIALLPRPAVLGVVAALFAIDADQAGQPGAKGFRRVALISFGVLFAAEWGDSSQLATAAMVARYDALVPVFLASWLALVGVAVLAATAGRLVLKHVPVRWVQRVAGLLFGAFALIAAYQLVVAL